MSTCALNPAASCCCHWKPSTAAVPPQVLLGLSYRARRQSVKPRARPIRTRGSHLISTSPSHSPSFCPASLRFSTVAHASSPLPIATSNPSSHNCASTLSFVFPINTNFSHRILDSFDNVDTARPTSTTSTVACHSFHGRRPNFGYDTRLPVSTIDLIRALSPTACQLDAQTSNCPPPCLEPSNESDNDVLINPQTPTTSLFYLPRHRIAMFQRGTSRGQRPAMRNTVLALLSASMVLVNAQSDQCISLRGSEACKAFDSASISKDDDLTGA